MSDLANRLRGGPAVQKFGSSVPEEDAPVELPDDDRVVSEIEQGRLLFQAFFGLTSFGDVPHDFGEPAQRALFIADLGQDTAGEKA